MLREAICVEANVMLEKVECVEGIPCMCERLLVLPQVHLQYRHPCYILAAVLL